MWEHKITLTKVFEKVQNKIPPRIKHYSPLHYVRIRGGWKGITNQCGWTQGQWATAAHTEMSAGAQTGPVQSVHLTPHHKSVLL